MSIFSHPFSKYKSTNIFFLLIFFIPKVPFQLTKCIHLTRLVMGPPPPPLPPPLKAQISNYTAPIEVNSSRIDQSASNESSNVADNDNDSDEIDSDFGLEVIEEPTLRPSELVRGNHNRTMSTISGKLNNLIWNKNKKRNYNGSTNQLSPLFYKTHITTHWPRW